MRSIRVYWFGNILLQKMLSSLRGIQGSCRASQLLIVALICNPCLLSRAFPQAALGSSDDTLAIVGSRVITAHRFAELYTEKVVMLGLTDNGQTRTQYLSNLVDDEVFIVEAIRRQLDRTTRARSERARLQLQELLNAYSVKHLSPHLQVTDEELRELFVHLHTKVKVRHLYAPTREEARSLYIRVRNGRSFEELAESTFTDPVLKRNGGLLGYVSADEMDPAFERAMFAMKPGEISSPVRTVQGYSIIKVEDVQGNPLVTETEFFRSKERLARFARKRKYEELVTNYTAQLRLHTGLRFDSALVTRLYVLSQHEKVPGNLEHASSSLRSSDLSKTVAFSNRGNWNTRRLVDLVSTSSDKQRNWVRTREDFEDYLAGIIMRTYIAGDARREGLDTTQAFRDNVRYKFDTYLLTTLEEQLKGEIRIPPDSVCSFYLRNKDRFATPRQVRLSGILVENALMADSVRRLLEQGIPFDQAAGRFSVQTQTAQYGGDMGFLGRKELGDFADTIFAMNVGEWKGPFVGEGKYLFVKATGTRPSSYRSLDETSNEVRQTLVNIAWSAERRRQLAIFRRNLECRVYPEKLLAVHPISFKR